MKGWSTHAGVATCLMLDNIDTDQLLPARFMSQPRSLGYGEFLLHDLRRDSSGQLLEQFPLNQHPDTSILLSGRNFGSGSSREAAVYALIDAGIRVVVATSFGDIFSANAINNGLLPAQIDEADLSRSRQLLGEQSMSATVNLQQGTITLDKLELKFQLDNTWRTKLINGWDDIDLTMDYESEIATFYNERKKQHPWSWPTRQ